MAVLNRITPLAISLLLVAAFCVPPASAKTSYEYLMLVLQWPFAVCASSVCTYKYPPDNEFLIHGLWPANFSGAQLQCSGTSFDRSEMNKQKQLQTDLSTSWPNLTGDYMSFWSDEYNKHGTCCDDTFTQTVYFETAHKMWSHNHIEVMFSEAGYKPGNKYKPADLQAAVAKKITKDPALRCINLPSLGRLLLEVVICYDHDGKSIINCNSNLSKSCTGPGPATILYKDL